MSPDAVDYGFKMAPAKPKAEIIFERQVTMPDFNVTAYIARCCSTTENQDSGHQTGSGNNF